MLQDVPGILLNLVHLREKVDVDSIRQLKFSSLFPSFHKMQTKDEEDIIKKAARISILLHT